MSDDKGVDTVSDLAGLTGAWLAARERRWARIAGTQELGPDASLFVDIAALMDVMRERGVSEAEIGVEVCTTLAQGGYVVGGVC